MINGLDISHYPHRTPIENVAFFADKGFSSVSIYGFFMDRLCRDKELSAQLASVVNEKNIVLTVHHKLPLSHDPAHIRDFEEAIDYMAKWQEKFGLLSVLSFDVPQDIRDNVLPYINYVLNKN